MRKVVFRPVKGKEADGMIEASDRYMTALYPAESNHLIYLDELLASQNLFLGAFVRGSIAGCGAVVFKDEEEPYWEIKRLYVDEVHRGKNIGSQVMARLEEFVRSSDTLTIRLETGIYQPEAISLYYKLGYCQIEPFGEYTEDPLSIFMEKKLLQ